MKEKMEIVSAWIRKAESDLITAQHSLNIRRNTPYDTICFHAQQCAEKYLKAFLTFHEIEFEKIHDLKRLISLASKVDKVFIEVLELADKLTDYAVDIRYPFVVEEPTREEAEEAIKTAKEIKKIVLERLPVKKCKK
jgi:HEPN domain-containing protein